MRDFKGKVAVITGGASGIGLAIAQALVAEGAAVAIADVNEAAAKEAADNINNNGGSARAYRCDVTQRSDVESLADVAWTDFGHVDLLFNNAGVMPTPSPCLLYTSDAADERVRV